MSIPAVYYMGQDVTALAILAAGIIAGCVCLALFESVKWGKGR